MATAKELSEIATQERRSAEEFLALAEKHPRRADEYAECARLCYAQAEEVELLLALQREALCLPVLCAKGGHRD